MFYTINYVHSLLIKNDKSKIKVIESKVMQLINRNNNNNNNFLKYI